MSHRTLLPRLLPSLLVSSLLAACGSTIVVTDEDDDGANGAGGAGVGGATASPATVGPGPVTSVVATSVVVSSTAVTTDTTISSTGSGLPFGPPDLFEQPLGPPSEDRNLFTLSETALGAYVAARSPSQFSLPRFERLVAPSGEVIFQDFLPSNQARFENYQTASMVIPFITHAEMFPPAPGSWSVKVGGDGESTDITVLERRTEDGLFHGGAIDVNVFVVPGVGDPDYMREQIEQAYSSYDGLVLGEIRFYDAPDAYFEINENNYFESQTISAGAPAGQAVTLLAVGWIGGQLEGAAGFSPGAPADPLGHGGASSTLVWWVQNDGFFDGIIVGHESGHYAGLHHTTEIQATGEFTFESAQLYDPLNDTNECPEFDQDTYFNCADYSNLMHFAGGDGSANLSAQQNDVIRGSAIYRGSYAAGENPAPPFTGLRGQAIAAPAKQIRLDGLGTAARWPAQATPRALRAAMAPEIAMLDGIGCATAGPVEPLIAAVARSVSARELVDAASDQRLSPLLRMRALLAAGRARDAAEVAADLEAIASDVSQPDAVRAGALRSLERAAPVRRTALLPALRADASRLVRHLAR